MSPNAPSANALNGGFLKSVLAAKRRRSDGGLPNCNHVGIREFCARMILSPSNRRGFVVRSSHKMVSPAALGVHVRRIVHFRSKEKVCRVYAGWVIAPVQNANFVRDRAVLNLVRDAVRQALNLAVARVKHAVAFVIFIGLPQPAVRPLFHLGPKSLSDSASFPCHADTMGKRSAPVNMGVF